jgi:hypothetical protein
MMEELASGDSSVNVPENMDLGTPTEVEEYDR